MEAVEHHQTTLDNPGFCIRCGEDAESVEPDAGRYTCESAGEDGVFGAEELLMMTAFSAWFSGGRGQRVFCRSRFVGDILAQLKKSQSPMKIKHKKSAAAAPFPA